MRVEGFPFRGGSALPRQSFRKNRENTYKCEKAFSFSGVSAL